jgi:hypothetical protein
MVCLWFVTEEKVMHIDSALKSVTLLSSVATAITLYACIALFGGRFCFVKVFLLRI